MRYTFRSSAPHHSISPRLHTDASHRYRTYGPIQSMDADPFSKSGNRFCARKGRNAQLIGDRVSRPWAVSGIAIGLALLGWMATSVIPQIVAALP